MQVLLVVVGASLAAVSSLGWANARLLATRAAWLAAVFAGIACLAVGLLVVAGPLVGS